MTLGKHAALTPGEAKDLQLRAGSVFRPRTPITTRDLFAGRWNQLTIVADAVNQTGLHVAIYGERGVGKTSVANVIEPVISVFDEDRVTQNSAPRMVIKTNANSGDTFSSIWLKLFDEITWEERAAGLDPSPTHRSLVLAFNLPETITIDDVRRVLTRLPGAVFIIDEFDRSASATAREFTDLIKALSDFSVDCTVILVGVAETIDTLIADHASITRTLVQVQLKRMLANELKEILDKAESTLDITFSNEGKSLIVNISQGLPHYTHLLGLHSVRLAAGRLRDHVERNDVFGALKECVSQAEQTVTEKHSKATHSAHKDALYKHVLLACALTAANSHDALGYFNPGSITGPLSAILRRSVEIATFNSHLSDFCQAKRGNVLERIGQPRAYRFRFTNPLMVPFIFMDAVMNGIIGDKELSKQLAGKF
jgi:Cdc6-like AAA superfamily ATPase